MGIREKDLQCFSSISRGKPIELDEKHIRRIPKVRWCTKCRQWLPLDEFHLDRTYRGKSVAGLQTSCKACQRKARRRNKRKKRWNLQ
jgi:Zn finger protein HypA/HybF involved in hydrogenase expression